MCFGDHIILPVYPDQDGGSVIASLTRGDEVAISVGFGHPPSAERRVEIILAVEGYSALTAAGTRLMCDDGAGIHPTGKHFDNFEISSEAQAILDSLK